MNDIDKIYLIHDFTEYVIESGRKIIDIQAIDNFIQDKKCEMDCYMEAVTIFDEIENYLHEKFID